MTSPPPPNALLNAYVTLFASDKDVDGVPLTTSFKDCLRRPFPRATAKKALPMWSFTRFQGTRRTANARAVSGIVFDVDVQPAPTLEIVRGALAGLSAFVTTSSSSTPAAPRWRVGIMTDKPIPAREYKRVGFHVASLLPFQVASNSIEPSRAWYAPREPEEGEYICEIFEGVPLPLDTLLQNSPPPVEEDHHTVDAPLPRTLPPEELVRHMRMFEEYCQMTDDRGIVVAAQARCHELPPGEAADIIERTYAPRCAALDPPQPWSRENIVWKIQQVYDGTLLADFVFGPGAPRIPSAGFLERLAGHVPTPKGPQTAPDGTLVEDNCGRPVVEGKKISLANILADLRYHPKWQDVLRYDDLRKWITCTGRAPILLDARKGNITDVDFTRIRAWFERNGNKARKEDVNDSVEVVAKESRYNPILDYLNSLPKCELLTPLRNGTSVSEPADSSPARFLLPGSALSQLASRALGNKLPLAQDVLIKTLIAAVRRMRRPGTKVDTVLVMRGLQSKRKSTFLTILFGENHVKSQMSDLGSKDASVGLRGMWAVELAEMDRVIRAESSTVKEFLSRAIDSYRPPYGRTEEQFPRQCVFFGTTNDERFLVDVTGNRRFWVIEVTEYDLRWLEEHRDEIWAAANSLEAAGVPHWFENEEEAKPLQEPYEYVDEWEHAVRDYCAGRTTIKNASDVYVEAIARGDAQALQKMDKRIQNRIGGILRRMGCEHGSKDGRRWIKIPEWLTKEIPSTEEMSRRTALASAAALREVSSKKTVS